MTTVAVPRCFIISCAPTQIARLNKVHTLAVVPISLCHNQVHNLSSTSPPLTYCQRRFLLVFPSVCLGNAPQYSALVMRIFSHGRRWNARLTTVDYALLAKLPLLEEILKFSYVLEAKLFTRSNTCHNQRM